MSDKILKELNDEELEKVSGGGWAEEKSVNLPADHGAHIGKYDAENYIGQKFYIVNDSDTAYFYWGTLLASFEEDHIFFTERTHKMLVEGCSSSGARNYIGNNIDFSGDAYTLFLMH